MILNFWKWVELILEVSSTDWKRVTESLNLLLTMALIHLQWINAEKIASLFPTWVKRRYFPILLISSWSVWFPNPRDVVDVIASTVLILLEKIGIPSRMLSNDAIIHGTIFEIVSQTLYETRNF